MSKPKILTLFDENVEGSIYSKLNNPVTVTLTNRSLVVSGVVDVQDNSILTFKPGCSCTEVDSITINGKVYTIKDSSGSVVNGNSDTWSDGVVISVALDTADREAYILSSNFKTIGDHVSNKNNPHNVTADQLGALKKSGGTMTGAINMGNKSINNLADPVDDTDAVNKKYLEDHSVDSSIIDLLLQTSNIIRFIIVDQNNTPIQGITVQNLTDNAGVTQISDQEGKVTGVCSGTSVTMIATGVNYTVDVSNMKGSSKFNVVKLPSIENVIVEYDTSTSITFPSNVSKVDVCCVGGGGGGSGGYGHHSSGGASSGWVAASWRGKGGGGGNIVNRYNIPVTYGEIYQIVIGAGGAGSNTYTYYASKYGEQKAQAGGTGGTTTFLGVEASGGTGGTTSPGTSTNGGNGNSNATGTRFDDGITFYSGGGADGGYPVYAQGRPGIISGPVGGSPYGGYGGYTDNSGSNDRGVAGGAGRGAGGGGGGGNANPGGSSSTALSYMTKGGDGHKGLVVIRLHT